MPEIHKVVGLAVVALFGVTTLWGLGAILMKRQDAGKIFWVLVAIAQVAIGLQLILGVVLLLLGKPLPVLLHLAYGVFTAGALLWAQLEARRRTILRYVPFVWACLFAFGLSLRAFQTGVGG
jgi:hypothetical protein